MSNINKAIKFYHECYLQDFKGIKISDFFGKNAELQKTLPTNLLLVDQLEQIEIDEIYGKELTDLLLLDSKEKTLYLGSYFINGKIKVLGKEQRLFCPLYIHELELIEIHDGYRLKIGEAFINPIFLESVKNIDKAVDINYDLFSDTLPPSCFGYKNLLLIEKCLKVIMPKLDLSNLQNAINKSELDQRANTSNRKNTSSIHFGIAAGIFKKPAGTRGVLSELSQLAEMEIRNPLLYQILGYMELRANELEYRQVHVPVSLSEAQQDVFFSSDKNDITIVIGPPGTGKSFTIAALASECVSRGKSVLIASKNNQAGKVVSDKIENDLGLKNIVLKTSRKSYWRTISSRIYNAKWNKNVTQLDIDSQIKQIEEIQLQIDNKVIDFISAGNDELKWGSFYAKYEGGVLDVIRSKWYEYVKNNSTPVWKIYQSLIRLESNKAKVVKKFIVNRYYFELLKKAKNFPKDFELLISATQEESGNISDALLEKVNFDFLLKALSIWVCNSSDISNVLPLEEELFDVLIIDEASQCDIATTLPLIFRAKKIVIVGDPKQLRHYSFLSKFQQDTIREKLGLQENILDYRKNSILDLAYKNRVHDNQVVFLDEHYRSQPNLIDFSNQKFYESKLKVMTSNATSYSVDDKELVEVAGSRNSKGVNEKEAMAIIESCISIFKAEKKLAKKTCSKIGIISPFSKQVSFIKSALRKHVDSADLKKHAVLIGTPYHFQGEERDIVMLSFTVDDDTHHSVYNYLNKDDVFNVSITRARKKLLVFNSVDYKNLNPKYLLSQYLNSVPATRQSLDDYHRYKDAFANEVIDVISEWEIEDVLKYFPIAGVNVDLVVVKNEKNYCIDLIGFPGDFEEQFSLNMVQRLNRMQQPLFFLTYSQWFLEREMTIAALKKFIK